MKLNGLHTSTRFLHAFPLVLHAFYDVLDDVPLLLFASLGLLESLRCFPATHNMLNRAKLVLRLIASQIPMSRPVHLSSSKQREYLNHRRQNGCLQLNDYNRENARKRYPNFDFAFNSFHSARDR